MVLHFTPYSSEKDLGKAYNHYMSLIGEKDSACIRDLDTMFLTPDAGQIIDEYAEQNPGSVLVCYTNRIHHLAKEQNYFQLPDMQEDILCHLSLSSHIALAQTYKTTLLTGPLSGFLMVIPKSVWIKVPFREGVGLLGCDTMFYKDLRAEGIPILRMDGLYIWHTYRLEKDIKDTTHLR